MKRNRCHIFAEAKALQRLSIGVVAENMGRFRSPNPVTTLRGDSVCVRYLLKAIPKTVEVHWIEETSSRELVFDYISARGPVDFPGVPLVKSRLEQLETEHSNIRGTESFLKRHVDTK